MGANDFERAVPDAVLINPKNWHVIAVLGADDFSLDSHRNIFRCMQDLAWASRPIDILTLTRDLDSRKELHKVGDAGYIPSLVDGLPDRPLESVQHYVNEVRRIAGLRHVPHAADLIRQMANGSAAKDRRSKA